MSQRRIMSESEIERKINNHFGEREALIREGIEKGYIKLVKGASGYYVAQVDIGVHVKYHKVVEQEGSSIHRFFEYNMDAAMYEQTKLKRIIAESKVNAMPDFKFIRKKVKR